LGFVLSPFVCWVLSIQSLFRLIHNENTRPFQKKKRGYA